MALDVSPSWLQFGSEAIDKMDKEAIETAIALMKLPPTERDVYQAAISRAVSVGHQHRGFFFGRGLAHIILGGYGPVPVLQRLRLEGIDRCVPDLPGEGPPLDQPYPSTLHQLRYSVLRCPSSHP